ncbi:hypothetical protein AYI70_g8603 [Smittium culicis]|uniref:Uncharacterized protein n=1 Tax=Smittium culicis TaxID=133412 RepID=A0A1R1XF78_9FUNG|nr:hypothetical protein AYI70_g8603 [Smittium culicis]
MFPREYNLIDPVIDRLYLDALAEGGNLVVYEGGDGSRARQNLNNDFNSRFPDVVIYQFDKLVSKHGWEFIDKLIAQNVTWVRGSGTPVVMIGNNTIPDGVTFTSGNSLLPNPRSRAASIFKKAPHPAAAKLFIALFLSDYIQKSAFIGWSSRMDIPPKAGYKQITEYPNTSRVDFIDFMRNRTRVEGLKLGSKNSLVMYKVNPLY